MRHGGRAGHGEGDVEGALLGIKTGDKVLFVEGADGSVTMRNATLDAFSEARAAFAGAAEEAGLSDERDVVDLVRSVRRERAGA